VIVVADASRFAIWFSSNMSTWRWKRLRTRYWWTTATPVMKREDELRGVGDASRPCGEAAILRQRYRGRRRDVLSGREYCL